MELVLKRFLEKIRLVGEFGCWEWTACKMQSGYGKYQKTVAHRWAYEFFIRQIPSGLQMDHLCRNRACANPNHVEPVTHKENARRGIPFSKWANKTHCPSGHPYDDKNTLLYIRKNGHRSRMCIACRSSDKMRSYRQNWKRENKDKLKIYRQRWMKKHASLKIVDIDLARI